MVVCVVFSCAVELLFVGGLPQTKKKGLALKVSHLSPIDHDLCADHLL